MTRLLSSHREDTWEASRNSNQAMKKLNLIALLIFIAGLVSIFTLDTPLDALRDGEDAA